MSPSRRSGQRSDALRKTQAASSRPRERDCPGCGRAVLEARTTSGTEVRADRVELSPLQELEAVLAGMATYTWHRVPDLMAHRYPLVIRSRPAGTPRQTVHAIHQCDHTWQAADPRPSTAAASSATADDAPPY